MFEDTRIDPQAYALHAAKPDPRVKWTENGLLDDQSVAIYWNCPKGLVKEVADYVESTYRSVNNGELPFCKLSGYWRCGGVSYGEEGDIGKVTLILLKGYVTAIDWTTGKIDTRTRATGNATSISGVSGAASESSLHHVIVRLQWFDPKTINAVVASLNTGTKITNPVVMTETLTGVWYVHYAYAKIEDDTSASLYVALGLDRFCVHTVHDRLWWEEADAWYLYEVHYGDVQAIADSFKLAYPNGSTVTLDNSHDRKTVTMVLMAPTGLAMSAGREWWDIQPWQVGSGWTSFNQPSSYSPIPSSTAGVKYEAESLKNKGGKYNNSYGIWNAISGSGTFEGTVTAFERQSHLWFRNISDAPLEQESGSFGIIVNDVRTNDFRLFDGDSELRTPISGSGSFGSDLSAFQRGSSYWYRNASGSPLVPDPAEHQVGRKTGRANDFGLLDGDGDIVIPISGSGSYASDRSAFQRGSGYWFINGEDILAPEAGEGQIGRRDARKNAHDLWEGGGSIAFPISGSGSFTSFFGEFEERTNYWFRNFSGSPLTVDSGAGLVIPDARANDFALLDGETLHRVPRAASGSYVSSSGKFVIEERNWFRNKASPEALVAAGNQLVEAVGERNDFFSYDGTGRRFTPVSGSGTMEIDHDAFTKRNFTWFRNFSDFPVLASGEGDIATGDARPNDFSLLDGGANLDIPISGSGFFDLGADAFTSGRGMWMRNIALTDIPAITSESGVVRSQRLDANRHGKAEGTMQEQFPIPRSQSGYTYKDDMVERWEERHWNSDTLPDAGAGETSEGRLNDFQKYDRVLQRNEVPSGLIEDSGCSRTWVVWGDLQTIALSSYYYTAAEKCMWVEDKGSGAWELHGVTESPIWWIPRITSTPLVTATGKWKATHEERYFATESGAIAWVNASGAMDFGAVSGADRLTKFAGQTDRVYAGLWRGHRITDEFVVLEYHNANVVSMYSGALSS